MSVILGEISGIKGPPNLELVESTNDASLTFFNEPSTRASRY